MISTFTLALKLNLNLKPLNNSKVGRDRRSRWLTVDGCRKSEHEYCSCVWNRQMSASHNYKFPWIIFSDMWSEEVMELCSSAFAARMKHSKQRVMMQGKLGDCGGGGTAALFSFLVCKLGRLSLAGKSLTFRHTCNLRGLYLITHLWLLGTWCFCLLFTRAHTHIRVCMPRTPTDLDQREPWKEAQREDFSPLLYSSILP